MRHAVERNWRGAIIVSVSRRPSALAVEAQIVRVYADAVHAAFGAKLDDPAVAEFARMMIALAESVADCAEATARAQAQLAALAETLGLEVPPAAPPKPSLRLIDGDLV
jgi:hypothetical protein